MPGKRQDDTPTPGNEPPGDPEGRTGGGRPSRATDHSDQVKKPKKEH